MAKPKDKLFDNGAYVSLDISRSNTAPFTVLLRDPSGEVHDKVRTDTYRDASDYYKAFCNIAKNKWR